MLNIFWTFSQRLFFAPLLNVSTSTSLSFNSFRLTFNYLITPPFCPEGFFCSFCVFCFGFFCPLSHFHFQPSTTPAPSFLLWTFLRLFPCICFEKVSSFHLFNHLFSFPATLKLHFYCLMFYVTSRAEFSERDLTFGVVTWLRVWGKSWERKNTKTNQKNWNLPLLGDSSS